MQLEENRENAGKTLEVQPLYLTTANPAKWTFKSHTHAVTHIKMKEKKKKRCAGATLPVRSSVCKLTHKRENVWPAENE